MKNTRIIGVGNDLRGDDAAGLEVARALAEHGVENVFESSGETASLLDLWQDAESVILVDAAQSGAKPGTVTRLDASSEPLPAEFLPCSTHSLGLAEAVELGRSLGRLPGRVLVFGVEGVSFERGTSMHPEVLAGVATAVRRIEEELGDA